MYTLRTTHQNPPGGPSRAPRAIWAAGELPFWTSWAQSPLSWSKLYEGRPVWARVPPSRHWPHRPQVPPSSTAPLDPWFTADASTSVPPGNGAPVGRPSHRHHGCVLLGDRPGPATPRQRRGAPTSSTAPPDPGSSADPSTPVPLKNSAPASGLLHRRAAPSACELLHQWVGSTDA
jgi:hypothetical protein